MPLFLVPEPAPRACRIPPHSPTHTCRVLRKRSCRLRQKTLNRSTIFSKEIPWKREFNLQNPFYAEDSPCSLNSAGRKGQQHFSHFELHPKTRPPWQTPQDYAALQKQLCAVKMRSRRGQGKYLQSNDIILVATRWSFGSLTVLPAGARKPPTPAASLRGLIHGITYPAIPARCGVNRLTRQFGIAGPK